METLVQQESIQALSDQVNGPDETIVGTDEQYLHEANQILNEMLQKDPHGCVSSRKLREALERSIKCENHRELVVKLKSLPDVFHSGKSFYSKEAYDKESASEVEVLDSNSVTGPETDIEDTDEQEPAKQRNEESRLCRYVKKELDTIYWGQFGPEEAPVAFVVGDVHPGKKFENVDLIAIDWRSDSRAELVAVEVKLKLTAEAVSQAISYQRFCHRVWVAVIVSDDFEDAGRSIRESEPSLFDYIVSRGLGLLGCRKKQGNSYVVFPIHWPSRGMPDPVELDLFTNRYRSNFEEAMVVEGERPKYPKLH